MKIALINGSPKTKESASEKLLHDFKTYFKEEAVFEAFSFNKPQVDAESLEKLKQCEVFLFAFPLYVDGIPSQLLSCLQQIEEIELNKNTAVFCIVNSGFYEGKQNTIAIEILKNWCYKLELQWGMGIGLGGGGAISGINTAPGKGIKTRLGKAFEDLKNTK